MPLQHLLDLGFPVHGGAGLVTGRAVRQLVLGYAGTTPHDMCRGVDVLADVLQPGRS